MMRAIRKVVVGVSGGVDSAITSLMLKEKGFDVHGVFMVNWDSANETGVCSADQDREDAQLVCRTLDIPLQEVNFVKEYWNDVFMTMIQGYEEGRTPNPDVLCNRHIKFGSFFNYAFNTLGADAVATGLYARNSFGNFLENRDPEKDARLLMPKDRQRDQTLFLCQIEQSALRRCMFPMADMAKSRAREIARKIGLEKIARKKPTTGMCFVGNKNFHRFIEDYIEPKPGNFVDVETGEIVGKHKGIHYWTLGQRSLISGVGGSPFYVTKIDPRTRNVYVAKGLYHLAHFAQSLTISSPHWIHHPPPELMQTGQYRCEFRYQQRGGFGTGCLVTRKPDGSLEVELASPLRSLTPGQFGVFCDGEELLGSGAIIHVGPSCYELGHTELPPGLIDKMFVNRFS